MSFNGCVCCGTLLMEGHLCHKCMKFNFNTDKPGGEAVNAIVKMHGVNRKKWSGNVFRFKEAFASKGVGTTCGVVLNKVRRGFPAARIKQLKKLGRAEGQTHMEDYVVEAV